MKLPPLLRSLLFVPGDSPRKMQKAAGLAADALVLDWEDAVLPQHKPAARRLTAKFLAGLPGGGQTVLVRINSAAGGLREDLEALESSLPDGIMLSKCRVPDEVALVDEFLGQRDAAARCRIYPLIESPAGLLNAHSIATASPRVAALAFGAEDFSAEAQITRTDEEIELLYARSVLVTACRAAGCEPIDSPCMDFHDSGKLRASAQRARNLGFSGKLAIHPGQLTILNECFVPSASEVAQARRLLEAFAAAGSGVLALDGAVVDEAVLRRARRIVSLSSNPQLFS